MKTDRVLAGVFPSNNQTPAVKRFLLNDVPALFGPRHTATTTNGELIVDAELTPHLVTISRALGIKPLKKDVPASGSTGTTLLQRVRSFFSR